MKNVQGVIQLDLTFETVPSCVTTEVVALPLEVVTLPIFLIPVQLIIPSPEQGLFNF